MNINLGKSTKFLIPSISIPPTSSNFYNYNNFVWEAIFFFNKNVILLKIKLGSIIICKGLLHLISNHIPICLFSYVKKFPIGEFILVLNNGKYSCKKRKKEFIDIVILNMAGLYFLLPFKKNRVLNDCWKIVL